MSWEKPGAWRHEHTINAGKRRPNLPTDAPLIGAVALTQYAAANELIKQHGDAADIEAAMRADERLAAGDMKGEAVWFRIVKAVEELLAKERPSDEKVH